MLPEENPYSLPVNVPSDTSSPSSSSEQYAKVGPREPQPPALPPRDMNRIKKNEKLTKLTKEEANLRDARRYKEGRIFLNLKFL